MINITEDQKAFLCEQGVAFDDSLEKDDLETLPEIIDDAIVDNIVEHNDESDEIGIQLQRIYDQIRFIQNEKD